MPSGEQFWNPYRWVTVSDRAVEHDVPQYHHRLNGIAGRLWCEIKALTPLFVGDGAGHRDKRFVRHERDQRPYIPATSLKGAIRSLAEIVGNAAVPFPGRTVDHRHRLPNAQSGSRLDVVARTFGHLARLGADDGAAARDGGRVFAGLIRFSDAELAGDATPHQWPRYEVVVGQPKPSHRSFYPNDNRRKLYHHRAGAKRLTEAPPNINQTATVSPAPPGTRFRFTVDFENLREHELDLLLYCLVLEEETTVELSAAALGRDRDQPSVTLRRPLRHKLGGAKPHGAGSVHLRVTKLQLRTDPAARYRGKESVDTCEGKELEQELSLRTSKFRERTDQTMQELRAMLIYVPNDPRNSIKYPDYGWFNNHGQTGLKPTT